MHFFNPVPLMALVEVVAGPMTEPAVIDATATRCAHGWARRRSCAADTPGFIVNRVARPFYLEAMRILGEGLAGIDERSTPRLRGVGFRMGPFELIDAIGADVNFAVSQSVYEQFFYDPRYRPHPLQRPSSTPAGSAARPAAASTTTGPMGERADRGPALGSRPDGPRREPLTC